MKTQPGHMEINPFHILSPETMSAEDTVSLFVEVFSDLPKIRDVGNVFLVGPRGSGKSMMFRYLMPDCQCLVKNCALSELPFLGIYVPLKNTNFTLAELRRLDNRHASDVLSCHLLATHFAVKALQALADAKTCSLQAGEVKDVRALFEGPFFDLLEKAYGKKVRRPTVKHGAASDLFKTMANLCERMYREALDYAKHLAFTTEIAPYTGPLCDFMDFFLPLVSALSGLPFMPREPVYLLIDDAHWLSEVQARALNSWVATRTSMQVSLKISTQANYATYFTLAGPPIETPHDYSEIDISTLYTTSRTKYRDRVQAIVTKRLKLAKIRGISVRDFFPEDIAQEEEISRIAEDYRRLHDQGNGRGYYRGDDALRYARPDYIRSRAGTKKSSSKYSYAGFEQLVHLSSGVIRFFLEPAHRMFATAQVRSPKKRVRSIPPEIQSDVVRREADRFLFDDLENLERGDDEKRSVPKEDVAKLFNLIQGLGGLFRQILLSDRSERRVFSIALSDEPSDEVKRLLNLGVQLGYFHKSTIGRKDSRSGGRTRLYVLSRRLAPIWNLDPTGFAGYLFITDPQLREAVSDPHALLRRIARKGLDEEFEPAQLTLF